jgi:5-methylcytosine-specific restriction endonuclease McrA
VKQNVSPLSIDQVHVHFTASTAFAKKLEAALALFSHEYPQGKLADIFEAGLDLLLKKKTPKRDPASISKEESAKEEATEKRVIDSRYIPRGIQDQVRTRDENRCRYVAQSGKRCEATRFLELDHLHPWSLGGSSHDPDNLQLLCSVHNKLRAQETFGFNHWLPPSPDKTKYSFVKKAEDIVPKPNPTPEPSIKRAVTF